MLRDYNKWYICQIELKKETTKPDEMDIEDQLVLNGMTWEEEDEIGYNTIGEFQTSEINMPVYYIV